MRDILLLAIIVGGSLWALRTPWIGVVLWTWVSLMNPHQYSWKAAEMPVAAIVAVCTLVGLFGTKEKHNPFMAPVVWVLLVFVLWTCVTLPFSFYLDESLPLWERSIKIFLMLFVTLALVNTQKKLNVFIWIVVLSIGFYGVKGGIFTVLTGGTHRVWGPGGFIGGNNEVALAVIMVIPLMRYLQQQMQEKWQRLAMGCAMALSAIMALGSYSRGAFLALAAMGVFLWWKGKQKFAWGIALVTLAVVVLPFMPDHWWARMATIQTYQEDGSALGRINAWWMAWNLASDRFFGGGFMIYKPEIFAVYSPDPSRVHAAHSIYFQVLGEHGFVGFGLFVLVGMMTWLTARNLMRRSVDDSSFRWAGDLGAMAQVSMVGYAAGGAFLSLAYFDLPYIIMVMLVLAQHFMERRMSQSQATMDPGRQTDMSSDRRLTPRRLPHENALAAAIEHDRRVRGMM